MKELDGAILIGGQSRRMGRDKAGLVLGEQTVLERITLALRPLVTTLRLVGRASEPLPEAISDLAVKPDRMQGLGPLSGIHAALSEARNPVLVVACDMPFVTTELLAGLAARLEPPYDAVVPELDRGPVAVCALYRPRCLGELEKRLRAHELSAQNFVRALQTRWVRANELSQLDPAGRCLMNLNTPADYEAALAVVDDERRST